MTRAESKSLPLLPLRFGVVLPGTLTPIPVGRARSKALLQSLEIGDRFVVGVQFDSSVGDPGASDLHPIAVVAELKDKREGKRGAALVVAAEHRVRLTNVEHSSSGWEAEFESVEETRLDTEESTIQAESLRSYLSDLADNATVSDILAQTTEPGVLADRIASFVDLEPEKKVEVLHCLDVQERLTLVTALLKEARARVELKEKIDSEVRKELSSSQREMLLRQQLRAIRKELGELGDDSDEDEGEPLRKRLEEADLPEDVRKVAQRELRRLEAMPEGQAESHVIRKYLELIADLPWKERAETTEDIDAIAKALDEDHYGLEDVKRRVLEHMAVLKLSANPKGTILALAGPPGVGKTSLAQSVARATGRPLARVSLGGIRDEAEIRGHRRTYVGALPGRILHALRKVGVKNPVMVLDEVDKLGRGWAGNPEAALLEVLDPEQNDTFTDHYLEIPFDLSEVLFIATANEISALSAPLRDRLEIIEVNGYTIDEKVHIGREHLWPKKLEEHGLLDSRVEVSNEVLETIVKDYTREAGVRQLTRELAKLCRSVALDLARSNTRGGADFPDERLRKILGRPKFFSEAAEEHRQPGIAAGLAWTPVGGDVLYIETTLMSGKGKLEITGQLGDVMNESARAALAYIRSRADFLGVDASFLESHDLHIHVPAGGVPKDGPSAGVTIFTALTSLLSGRRVRPDTAMTGEATLRGRVLPVGGIKSKVLAAHRAGFKRVVLPMQNQRDLDEIPAAVQEQLEIIFAQDMQEVLDAALEPASPERCGTRTFSGGIAGEVTGEASGMQ